MLTKPSFPAILVLATIFMFACNFLIPDDDFESEAPNLEIEVPLEVDVESSEGEFDKGSRIEFEPPSLEIQPVPTNALAAYDVFEYYIDVFEVSIYASEEVPREKVLHAAGVMAQYLDNNEDGKPDNPAVVRELVSREAVLFMFPLLDSRAEGEFIEGLEEYLDDGELAMQPLYGEESIPGGPARGEFDPTLEEVLHLITNSGYAYAYPDTFGERPGTQIAEAMDVARGGYFNNVPTSYPAGAWFTYDDRTCDYACMISEYHYWALTSILGGQDLPGRYEEIQHEWILNTAVKVREGDPAIYDLLTNPAYAFPTILPNGAYSP